MKLVEELDLMVKKATENIPLPVRKGDKNRKRCSPQKIAVIKAADGIGRRLICDTFDIHRRTLEDIRKNTKFEYTKKIAPCLAFKEEYEKLKQEYVEKVRALLLKHARE